MIPDESRALCLRLWIEETRPHFIHLFVPPGRQDEFIEPTFIGYEPQTAVLTVNGGQVASSEAVFRSLHTQQPETVAGYAIKGRNELVLWWELFEPEMPVIMNRNDAIRVTPALKIQ